MEINYSVITVVSGIGENKAKKTSRHYYKLSDSKASQRIKLNYDVIMSEFMAKLDEYGLDKERKYGFDDIEKIMGCDRINGAIHFIKVLAEYDDTIENNYEEGEWVPYK